ncbi:MAG TPA: flavin reductase family protein [Pseudonocardia sp.]|nr:flavin reductase family protein [Pseudonocardia sp.]
MARFATGVTVLTAGGEHSHGMTANAFTSLSLDPPLVLCCVARTASMHDRIAGAGAFAVNILAADQRQLARYFADKQRPRGAAQFEPVAHRPGPHTGAPVLDGALAWVECRLARTHDGGDHSIFVGEVLASGRGPGTRALSFFGGDYHELGEPRRASA